MTGGSDVRPRRERWAQFRFSVVGPLLAAPSEKGELRAEMERLAAKTWRHPITEEPTRFGRSTIQKWYYQAKRAQRDPVTALARKVRTDSGATRGMKPELKKIIVTQHEQHPGWSYKLRHKNLDVIVKATPELAPLPSYRTFLRFMKANGLIKRKRKGRAGSPGARRAEYRFEHREVRSYESEFVNALWHYDFHHSWVRVLLSRGEWAYPVLCGILDDHSRLCCHAQWYLAETAQNLIHALVQAYLKRGLPRSDLSDNGAAMIAHETTEGLTRLGIVHETTLPYSPNQNGKQESFWSTLEGQLVAMLEGAADLTLAKLNDRDGVQPRRALVDRLHAAGAFPERQGRRAAVAAARAASRRVNAGGHAHPAAKRRDDQPRGRALRSALALRPREADSRALRVVGPLARVRVRPDDRRGARHDPSPGQAPQRGGRASRT